MNSKYSLAAISMGLVLAMGSGCGGGDDGPSGEPLFQEGPECDGETIVALAGSRQMVMDSLQIGSKEDGFDLDGDGEPDNKFSALSTLARVPLEDSFLDYLLVLPFEFFDVPDTLQPDQCVKFAIYSGTYQLDRDDDDDEVAKQKGDCNDFDPAIHRRADEIPDNGVDDNCNGLADEIQVGEVATPSDDTQDLDVDGVTIADGDCDDRNPMVRGPGFAEICGDGFDNNCDGAADWAFDDLAFGKSVCSPYDEELDALTIDELSFKDNGDPHITFTSGQIIDRDGRMMLEAGPGRFSVVVPLDGSDSLNLDLRISGATVHGELVEMANGWGMQNGRLGGILDANTIDKITGLEIDEIGLAKEDTFLDAAFANILGTLLALQRLGGDGEYADCQIPDIDTDRDGLEAFCDTDILDEAKTIDACIDGDGSVFFDEVDGEGNVTKQCTAATDDEGNLRFLDGISIEFNFSMVPAALSTDR